MSGAISQAGAVSPGHVAIFGQNGVVRDGGPASGGNVSELGITSSNGASPAFSISTAATSVAFNQFSIGVNQATGAVTFTAGGYLGAPAASVYFNINGTVYPFPGPGSGTVVGPNTSSIGHAVLFNSTTGLLISDAGAPPVLSPGTVVSGNAVVFNGTTGSLLSDAGKPPLLGITSNTSGNLVGFSGTTGKAILDSGVPAAAQALLTYVLLPPANSPARNFGISTAPAYTGNEGNFANAFLGDFSKVSFLWGTQITGTGTLGQPSTGYQYTPPASGVYGFLLNESGWNQATNSNVGRTAATAFRTLVNNYGQGDCMAYSATGFVDGARAGATTWLANPAVSVFVGDVYAGAAGVYLNPVEIDLNDQGFDCAGIGPVVNLARSVTTQALGETWEGMRVQSIGSAAPNCAWAASGAFFTGLDLSAATFGGTNAILLPANTNLNFNATNSGGFSNGSNGGNCYAVYASSNSTWAIVNGSKQINLSTSAMSTNCQIIAGGIVNPGVDNTYSCGANSFRWSAVWAANGTIQTSDVTLKTDIRPLPAALPLVEAINPIRFKWITGGHVEQTEMVEQDVPVTETKMVKQHEMQIVGGVPTLVSTTVPITTEVYEERPVVDAAGAPVMVTMDGAPEAVDADGQVKRAASGPRTVQRTHRVVKTERKMVPVTKMVATPGKRDHWGFAAQDIKAAFDRLGGDFGGYVKAEDGSEHMRPDQMIPVLWKAVQELSQEISLLKSAKAA